MKKLLFSVSMLMTVNAFSLTLGEIKTNIRRNVRDTAVDSALQRYSSSLLNDMVNETQREIINQTWAIESEAIITPAVGTVYYSLPSDYIAAIKVSYRKGTSAPYELSEVSRKGLFSSNPSWATTTGSPTQYYIRQSTITDSQEIAFVPPINAAGAGVATLEYFASATTLSGDSDVPFGGSLWMVQYHDAIIYGVTAKLKLIEGRMDEATTYFTLYSNAIAAMKSRIGDRPNLNTSISVGTPR